MRTEKQCQDWITGASEETLTIRSHRHCREGTTSHHKLSPVRSEATKDCTIGSDQELAASVLSNGKLKFSIYAMRQCDVYISPCRLLLKGDPSSGEFT